MALDVLETTCCVVGGGPAGMMLGYLLARKGVQVVVLEKHQDFFRDFRGDTVHPSTLEVLNELGLLEEFLNLPHEKVESLGVIVGDSLLRCGRFSACAGDLQIRGTYAAMGFPELSFGKSKAVSLVSVASAARGYRSASGMGEALRESWRRMKGEKCRSVRISW